MFIKIDDWMFDRIFQRFADWFTDHTGRSPHWLAATCAYVYAGGLVVEQVYFPSDTWIGTAFRIIFFILVLFIAFRNDTNDKRLGLSRKGASLNPFRQDKIFFFLRIVGLPICAMNLFDFFKDNIESPEDILRFAQSLVFLCFLYFEACESKPPAPPKRKEKLAPSSSRS